MTTYGQWKQGTAEFLMSPRGYAFDPMELMREMWKKLSKMLGFFMVPFMRGGHVVCGILFILGIVGIIINFLPTLAIVVAVIGFVGGTVWIWASPLSQSIRWYKIWFYYSCGVFIVLTLLVVIGVVLTFFPNATKESELVKKLTFGSFGLFWFSEIVSSLDKKYIKFSQKKFKSVRGS